MRFLGGGVGHQHARYSHVEELPTLIDADDDFDMAEAAAAGTPAGQSEDRSAAHQEGTSQESAEVAREEDNEDDDDEEVDFGYLSDSSEDELTGLAEGDVDWEDDPNEGDIAALEGYAEL